MAGCAGFQAEADWHLSPLHLWGTVPYHGGAQDTQQEAMHIYPDSLTD